MRCLPSERTFARSHRARWKHEIHHSLCAVRGAICGTRRLSKIFNRRVEEARVRWKKESIITGKLAAVSRSLSQGPVDFIGGRLWWRARARITVVRREISHQCQFQGSESVRSTVTLKRVDIYRPTRSNVLPGLCDAHHGRVIHVSGMPARQRASQITHIHLY